MSRNRSKANKGRALERDIEFTNSRYHGDGLAIVKKIEVPKTFDKSRGNVIYLAKTGCDYEGVLMGGRAVYVEAKDNDIGRLPIVDYSKKGDGIKMHQLDALLDYGNMGALVGVVWGHHKDGDIYFLDEEFLKHIKGSILPKRKSVPWSEVQSSCRRVKYVEGFLDYLELLGGKKKAGDN